MSEQEFSDALEDILDDLNFTWTEGEDVLDVRRVCSFKERGVLTGDSGIVVTLESGEEFQLTIVQSKRVASHKG